MLNTNLISRQIEEYITYMNSIGRKLEHSTYILYGLGRFTREKDYAGTLNWSIVKEYCERDGNKSTIKTRERRFEVISSFSKYVSNLYPNCGIMPIQPYGRRNKRPRPHIYTDSEITTILSKCNSIYSPDGLRRLSLATAICVMLTTGIRTSELINLKISDIDTNNKTLIVRNGKNGRQRLLPLTDSTLSKILEYRTSVESITGIKASPESPFLVTTGGRFMSEKKLEYAFSRIRDCIDVSDSDYDVPILYHLRHTFACRTIQNWIDKGIDVNSRLYVLSTYLGHVHPEDTYWYLSATDSLMKSVSSKYEENFGGDENEEQ